MSRIWYSGTLKYPPLTVIVIAKQNSPGGFVSGDRYIE